MPRLFVDGVSGDVCIHVSGYPEAVANPLGNLARVLFHSALTYPAVITGPHTYTINLPSRGTGVQRNTHTVFAHGRGGVPMVLGYISSHGIPLTGSVPINVSGDAARWITLGADATNVVLVENHWGFSAPSTDVTLVIYVFDVTL